MATTVGYATMPVIPSLRGMTSGGSEFMRELDKLGTVGAQRWSESFRGAVSFRGVFDGGVDEARRAGGAMGDVVDRQLRDAGDGLGDGVREGWRDANGRLRDGLGRFVAEARDAGDQAGEGLGDGLVDGVEGANPGSAFGPAGAIGAGILVAVAGLGLAAGKMFFDEFGESMDRQVSSDKRAFRLGLTPEEAKRYGEMTADIYYGAWGEDRAEVGEAFEAVFSNFGERLGLWDPALEKSTTRVLDLAGGFEISSDRIAQSIGIMESNFGNLGESFDLVYAALSGAPMQLREDVLEAMDEYGPFFDQLGLAPEFMVGAFVKAAEVGPWALDKTGDALKEFTIRATDMSTDSVGAFEALGLNAGYMAGEILAGGDRAEKAFDTIIGRLLGMKDPVAQANTAIALFGTPLEDLSTDQIPQFLGAMGDADTALGDWSGSLDKAGDDLNNNASTWIESIKRGFEKPFDEFMDNEVTPRAEKLAKAFETGGFEGLSEEWAKMWPEIETGLGVAWGHIQTWLDEHWPKISAKLGEVFGWATDELTVWMTDVGLPKLGAWVTDTLVPWLVSQTPVVIGAVIEWGKAWMGAWGLMLLEWMLGTVAWLKNDAIPTLSEKASDLWGAMFAGLGAAKDWVFTKLGEIGTTILTWLTNAPGLIASLASGMWDGITDSFKGMVNAIIATWNSFHIPAWSKEVPTSPWTTQTIGIPRIDFPDIEPIPLARGGILTKPLALPFAGEAGPEAILPLDRIPDLVGDLTAAGGSSSPVINMAVHGNELSARQIADLAAREMSWRLARVVP